MEISILANLDKASGAQRPQGVEAHHLVSAHDRRAKLARNILFSKGIGINDVDNGGYLPANATNPVHGLANAAPHRSIHTDMYHLNVYKKLQPVEDSPAADVRAVLRTIKADLISGVFIY